MAPECQEEGTDTTEEERPGEVQEDTLASGVCTGPQQRFRAPTKE